jgi:hypothetical protein
MAREPAADMTTGAFTRGQIERFRNDGFVIVRGLFGGERMAEIRRWMDELEAYPEEPGGVWFYYEDSLREPDKRVLSRIEHFEGFHGGLSWLMRGPALQERASELFGEPAVLFKEKVNFKMPGGRGFEPHQDVQAGWRNYGEQHLTALVSIDRASEENGCLELAAGQHRRGLFGELWKPLAGSQLDGVVFEKVVTEPGDAIFFDSFVPHRSAPNMTDHRRRVLLITYGRASEDDHRDAYFADKRRSYPPDIERDPARTYEYKV